MTDLRAGAWRAAGLALLLAFAPACSRGEDAAAGSAAEAGGPVPQTTAQAPPGVSGELVFQSDVGGRPQLFRLTLPSGTVVPVAPGSPGRDETPRWSPDGARILFASDRATVGAGEPTLDLYVMDADGANVRRLTSAPGNERDGSWAPDGRSVVYWSDGESRGDLYRLWIDDGRIERLTHNFVGRAIMPTVSPDGTQVAFASQTLRAGAFWNYQVQVLDLASKQVRPVGDSGGTCWPVWLGDSQHLGFVQLEPEPSRIQRRAVAGGPVETVATAPDQWLYYPRLSPDGQWLAVATSPEHHEGEDWDLALVRLDGTGGVVRLTTGAGNDRLPDWRPTAAQSASAATVAAPAAPAPAAGSPRGTLLFQSDREGRDKLYTLDVQTGAVRALTHGADHRDEEPAWSPDGQRIAFHTNRFDPATYDLAVMNADGSGVTRVTDHAAFDQDPAWTPDGSALVFTSERDGTGAIFRVHLADHRVTRLSKTSDRAIMPAVSPDGRRVAFAAATARGFQILVVDLQTGDERQVTTVEGGACRPAWSPDGTRIAYVRLEGERPSRLEVLDLASGTTAPLVPGGDWWSYYPSFSTDGQQVALAVSPEHHEGEDWDLAVVDPAAPEGFRRLTQGAGNDRVPQWKP